MTDRRRCKLANTEGDICQLPEGHALHQDGVGDDWGVRWGYEQLDLTSQLAVLRAQRDAALAACDEAERFFAEQNIMRPLLTTVAVRAALGVQPEPGENEKRSP
jgi:hypothetical protein